MAYILSNNQQLQRIDFQQDMKNETFFHKALIHLWITRPILISKDRKPIDHRGQQLPRLRIRSSKDRVVMKNGMFFTKDKASFLGLNKDVHLIVTSVQILVFQSRKWMELNLVLLEPPPPNMIIRLLIWS